MFRQAAVTWEKAFYTAQSCGPNSPLAIASLSELIELYTTLKKPDVVSSLLDRQESLEKSLSESFPGLAAVYYHRACLESDLGHWEKAVHWLNEAARKEPGYSSDTGVSIFWILCKLAPLYLLLGDAERCDQTIKLYHEQLLRNRRRCGDPDKRSSLLRSFSAELICYGDRIVLDKRNSAANKEMHHQLYLRARPLAEEALSLAVGSKHLADAEWLLLISHWEEGEYDALEKLLHSSRFDDICCESPSYALLFASRLTNYSVTIRTTNYKNRERLAAELIAKSEKYAKQAMRSESCGPDMYLRLLCQLGVTCATAKEYRAACDAFQQADKLSHKCALNDEATVMSYLTWYATSAAELKDYRLAVALYKRCLAAWSKHLAQADSATIISYYNRLSALGNEIGDRALAVKSIEAAIATAEQILSGQAKLPPQPQLNAVLRYVRQLCRKKIFSKPIDKPRLTELLSKIDRLSDDLNRMYKN